MESSLLQNITFSLIIENGRVLIPDQWVVPANNTNLSYIFTHYSGTLIWNVKVFKVFPEEGRISVDIVNYVPEKTILPEPEVISELKKFSYISFRNIDTALALSSRKKVSNYSQTPHLQTIQIEETGKEENPKESYVVESYRRSKGHNPSPKIPKVNIQRLREEFSLKFDEFSIGYGEIFFTHCFKGYMYPIDLKFFNESLREEYDAIKNYFANFLRTKKIHVTAEVKIVDGNPEEAKASSPEISAINEKTIEWVRFEFLRRNNKKIIKAEIDRTLFTMEDYFAQIGQEKTAKALFGGEKNFLETMCSIQDAIHYEHLRWLSLHHKPEIMRLRFVKEPASFIFLLEGEKYYYIVWETLSTKEATYVWRCDHTKEAAKRTLRKAEHIIETIKVQGKLSYIQMNEEDFFRIKHDYSTLKNGFIQWKGELESRLA